MQYSHIGSPLTSNADNESFVVELKVNGLFATGPGGSALLPNAYGDAANAKLFVVPKLNVDVAAGAEYMGLRNGKCTTAHCWIIRLLSVGCQRKASHIDCYSFRKVLSMF